MKIYKEKKEVISENPVWVCILGYYMYTGDTLIKLFINITNEYKSNKNFVG